MYMTRFILTAAVLLSIALCAPGVGQGIPVDGYAAIVNDRIITVSDVMQVVQPIERQLRETYQGDELQVKMEEAFKDARDSLVERALILVDFEHQEGQLPERAIDDRIDDIIRERFNNDRTALLETLAEERITPGEWRDQVMEQIVISLLRRQEVSQRINISPADVRARYEEHIEEYHVPEKVKLRMITLNKGATEEDRQVKRKEAEQILARLKEGEDFANLAKQSSEGSKASRGGDWGWTDPAILRPELRAVAEKLEAGMTSGILDLGEELYILRVEARQNASVIPMEDVQEDLALELRKEIGQRLYEEWMARLKNKYFVKIY